MSNETELLPCPFCGGEYTQVRWLGFKNKSNGAFESGFRGECTECFALTRAFITEAEAIAAWNARAERTCRNERGHCSICGAIMYDAPNYCPNCGAKVVEP